MNTITLGRARLLWARLDSFSPWRIFQVVAGPIFVVYLVTATWAPPAINDTYTNALSSWNLGTKASFYLEDHEELTEYLGWRAWIVPTASGSAAAMYPPGVSIVGAPFYAVWPDRADNVTIPADEIPWGLSQRSLSYPQPPTAPAVIAAAFATAGAIGLLALVFAAIGSPNTAIAGAYVAGLGTAAWSVAADQLWQHGPAMLWIAMGLALAASRPGAAGIAFGAAILTRPPTAVIVAATGLYRAWVARHWRPAVLLGAGSSAGLVLYLLYNRVVFGSLTLSAGYGSAFETAALESPGFDYLQNLFLAGFSFHRGVFVWSPFLLLLVPGLVAAWRAAPDWVRGAALGGFVYLLVQYKLNRYSGGFAFATYRYPLEGLTALAPLLYLAHRHWVARWRQTGLAFLTLALLSIALQLLAAVGITPLLIPG